MVKVYRVPRSVLQNHPIMPKDATESDVAYIEEEDEECAAIVVQTESGSVVFDSGCGLTRFQQEPEIFGSIQTSDQHAVGSTLVEEAIKICRDYIKSKG